ncbi:hypothetical protein HFO02_09290 [Rhizobium laguerreae]|uniref:hypothetical protein n=1 Tax=Rhizobium laguerreae TaxID=1076926 RepID=UPI001C925D75|nr:hypothetical protein [Rhizobium laguerreae]MBY3323804.1 hypothetical protein [Rhizobium laguerreae]
MNELFAAIARPGALERIKEHVSYLQSVSSTIKEFRTSFALAFDANAALRRSSRRQVATELDSVLRMLSITHPTPDPETLWDQKFRKTKWNSWARLQAVSSGLEIIGSMILSVIDEHGSVPPLPLVAQARLTAIKSITSTLLSLIEDMQEAK